MAHTFIDNFLGNLQTSEKKAVGRYLRSQITNAEQSKTMEVFEQLSEGRPVQYGSPVALNKIKSRIFEMSLDALMMDDDYLSTAYSEVDYLLIKLKKDMLKCRILQLNINENKTVIVLNLLNHIIEESRKNEIYTLLVEALTVKKYFIGNRSEINEFKKINEELSFYKKCENFLFDAVDRHHTLIINQAAVNQLTQTQFNNHIKQSILQLKKNYKHTGSQQINYYLHIMQFAYNEQKKDYKKCIKTCHNLIKLIEDNSLLYRKQRIGFAYNNLSLFYLLSNNYRKAEQCIIKAEEFFQNNSLDMFVSLDEKFHIFFHQAKYHEAEKCIESIMNHSLVDSGKFRKAKFIFYRACLLFTKKEFKSALALISKPLEVEKDKSVWSVSLRIFTIMLYIELNKISDASRTLEALRKYLDRNKQDDKIKKRDHLITKCLRELEKNDFEYAAGNKTLDNMLTQLSAKNSDVAWEYFSPELIPFHEWLLKKAKKK